jgi:alkylhydroperoxidase family enzyme
VENRGRATEESKAAFFEAGYNEANMVDVVMVVGDKIISNYIHNLTGFEIDFPLAETI